MFRSMFRDLFRPSIQSVPGVAATLLLLSCVVSAQDRAPRQPVRAGTDSGQQLRAPADRDEFSVAIFGDRTGGPRKGLKVLEEGIRMANHLDATFVMTVGDLVQGYNREAAWRLQAAEFKGLMSHLEMPWYPVAGNHDVYARPNKDGGHIDLYKEQFGPLYYSFDYKWAHFIALFSDEKLDFHNPAKTQNMSPKQMQWLRDDLAKTEADQVFVFLHHPRWNYDGCNWPDVHAMLAADGRVQAVIAGHIDTYRDDGISDGIHYYSMATTGGHRPEFRDSANIHHINHLLLRPDRWTMCVLPVGNIYGDDFVLGSEVDAMHELADNALRVLDAAVLSATEERDVNIVAEVRNPTDRRLPYKVAVDLPDGWTLRKPLHTDHGDLEAGKDLQIRLPLRARFKRAKQRSPLVRVTLHYPLRSGLRQEIALVGKIPIRVTGLTKQAAPRGTNKVLALDGNSAIRVELSSALRDASQFTVECWVRGTTPMDRAGLLAKTESSGFGIFWSERGKEPMGPAGYVHVAGHGYIEAKPTRGWAWQEWTHVALCYDGEWLRFFVDGSQQAATQHKGQSGINTSGVITSNEHPFYIGADPNSRGQAVSFFTGSIDDVRVSKVARYDKKFSPPRVHASDAETILLLHFDTNVRGLSPDASTAENHGWPVGKPRLQADPRQAAVQGAGD